MSLGNLRSTRRSTTSTSQTTTSLVKRKKIIKLHIRHTFQHIFVWYSTQLQLEITKFDVLTIKWAYMYRCESFGFYFHSETTRPKFWILRPYCTMQMRWPNHEKLTILQSYIWGDVFVNIATVDLKVAVAQYDYQCYIHRGYYTVARRYEFYVRVARTISHEWAKRTSEILFFPRD